MTKTTTWKITKDMQNSVSLTASQHQRTELLRYQKH